MHSPTGNTALSAGVTPREQTPDHFHTSDPAWSQRARRDMQSLPREPFWLCEWRDVVFLHLETDPDMLQSVVPFDLDLLDGRAFVSLVAFTLNDMHPRVGGRLVRALFHPFGTHRFLNVRAYVRHHGNRGIYFLAEYLDAPRLNHIAAPLLYGLPFHLAQLDYRQSATESAISGTVVGRRGTIRYEGRKTTDNPSDTDAFLLERYRAFTHGKGRQGWFPVWHRPWPYQCVEAQLIDNSLLRATGEWADDATLISAHYSEGFAEVWMGLRQNLNPN